MVLAIAYSESRLNYDVVHSYVNKYKGIGGISKPLWLTKLNKANIHINSLQAIEHVYEEIGLRRYKGSKLNNKSYADTLSFYYAIKDKYKWNH